MPKNTAQTEERKRTMSMLTGDQRPLEDGYIAESIYHENEVYIHCYICDTSEWTNRMVTLIKIIRNHSQQGHKEQA